MKRREFLVNTGSGLLMLASPVSAPRQAISKQKRDPDTVTLFLCGDVMTGRGIDQVLPHPGAPVLYEPYIKTARGYVALAEQVNGPIPRPVDFTYPWGNALKELEQMAPDVAIINLETSVTTSDDPWPGKGIHYRMNPANIPCITVAKIDCCALANNHVLDWGYSGLEQTLETLTRANVNTAGTGRDLRAAEAPAVIEVAGKGRVLVFSLGSATSGIPWAWAAAQDRPGIHLIDELSDTDLRRIATRVEEVRRPGDIVVASIHWGSNWGYAIPPEQRIFAHKLIDDAGVDVIHGHSSHHPKGIEVYRGKPVVYGCGDFLNDYEGIGGHEQYRSDLVLMYFVHMDPSSRTLIRLDMTPMRIKRFRAQKGTKQDALWMRDTLHREGETFGTRVEINLDHTLTLRWG